MAHCYVITTGARLIESCEKTDPDALFLLGVAGKWHKSFDRIGHLRSGDAVRFRSPFNWQPSEGWPDDWAYLEVVRRDSDKDAMDMAAETAKHFGSCYAVVRLC